MKPEINFIGKITTPYTTIEQCPRNVQSSGPLCQITLYKEYQEGLLGLIEGQHILILYWLEDAERTVKHKKVRKGKRTKGTFALRSPHRPNPIGAAELTIEKLEAGQITVSGLDCLNNTQLIDIKPAMHPEAPLPD